MELSEAELRQLAHHTINITDGRDRFTGKDAFLIWQYVRFSPVYRDAYDCFEADTKNTKSYEEPFDSLKYRFCRRWNMSEPVCYSEPTLPSGFFFDKNVVRDVSDSEYLQCFHDWDPSPASRELMLLVSTKSDHRLILKQIASMLKDYKLEEKPSRRLKASAVSHLSDNFICYYFRCFKKLEPKDVKKAYRKFCGNGLQNKQLIKKVNAFRRDSKRAPMCFLCAPK